MLNTADQPSREAPDQSSGSRDARTPRIGRSSVTGHETADTSTGTTAMGLALHRAGWRPTRRERRTFVLIRYRDVSGVSGTGVVAEGTVFSDGTAVLRWLGSHPTTAVFDSTDDIVSTHGHGGSTRMVFDGSPAARTARGHNDAE